jgi:uncharacterized membrane protein (UPF0136 family)
MERMIKFVSVYVIEGVVLAMVYRMAIWYLLNYDYWGFSFALANSVLLSTWAIINIIKIVQENSLPD